MGHYPRTVSAGCAAGVAALVAGGLAAAPAHADDTLRYSAPVTVHPGSSPGNIATGDVTGDGLADLLLTTDYNAPGDPGNWSLWVYPQQPDGTLGTPIQHVTGGTYWSHLGLAVADLDSDGDQDVAVTTKEGVALFTQVDATLARTGTVPAPEGRDVSAVDVNNDDLTDLVVPTQSGIEVWWQTTSGFMASPAGGVSLSSLPSAVEAGDVTGDGLVDLAFVSGHNLQVRAQRADHSFAAATTYRLEGVDGWDNANSLAIGDISGDGLLDIAVTLGGNRPNASLQFWTQQPDGSLGEPWGVLSYDLPDGLEIADVDADGDNDIVVSHAGWDTVGVYRQQLGDFWREDLFAAPTGGFRPQSIGIDDLNNDGRVDLAAVSYNEGASVLYGLAPSADTTPPETTVTSGPNGSIQTRTASWAFAATEAATFQCSIDNLAFTACTSPATYENLANGSHKFAVRAVDLAGNIDPTPASRFVSVDGPDTTITSGPTGTLRATTATFAFTGGASYECALDNLAWSACTSPKTYDGLAPGTSHSFRVRAVNAAGIPDASPASRGFSLDTAANLGVTVAATPNPVKKGSTLTYTTRVTNTGPHAASGVVLTQGLPAGLTLRTATGCTGTTTVRCDLGSVAPGATLTITITATVTAAKGTLASTAAVTTSTWELNPANDSASASVTVGNGR